MIINRRDFLSKVVPFGVCLLSSAEVLGQGEDYEKTQRRVLKALGFQLSVAHQVAKRPSRRWRTHHVAHLSHPTRGRQLARHDGNGIHSLITAQTKFTHPSYRRAASVNYEGFGDSQALRHLSNHDVIFRSASEDYLLETGPYESDYEPLDVEAGAVLVGDYYLTRGKVEEAKVAYKNAWEHWDSEPGHEAYEVLQSLEGESEEMGTVALAADVQGGDVWINSELLSVRAPCYIVMSAGWHRLTVRYREPCGDDYGRRRIYYSWDAEVEVLPQVVRYKVLNVSQI